MKKIKAFWIHLIAAFRGYYKVKRFQINGLALGPGKIIYITNGKYLAKYDPSKK